MKVLVARTEEAKEWKDYAIVVEGQAMARRGAIDFIQSDNRQGDRMTWLVRKTGTKWDDG